MNYFTITIVTIIWIVVGYTLVFSPDAGGGLIGGFSHIGLRHVDGALFPA
jgi:ammonium transporter, Amt family